MVGSPTVFAAQIDPARLAGGPATLYADVSEEADGGAISG
jgi:hypothetical protein